MYKIHLSQWIPIRRRCGEHVKCSANSGWPGGFDLNDGRGNQERIGGGLKKKAFIRASEYRGLGPRAFPILKLETGPNKRSNATSSETQNNSETIL